MSRFSLIAFTLLFVGLPSIMGAKEKNSPDLSLPQESLSSFQGHWKNFDAAQKKYHGALMRGRSSAASQGKVEEVKNIDEALQGGFTGDFSTYGPKSAKKSFESYIGRLSKSIVITLKKESDKVLGGEDGVLKAQKIQDIITQITEAQETSGSGKKMTFKVYANKDWQEAKGLEVEKGQTLKLYCLGSWAPGGKNTSEAGADTYKVGIRIDERGVGTSGKTSTITAERSGKLYFRMSNSSGRKALRSAAKGSMSVTVIVQNNAASKSLETILAQLLAPAADADENEAGEAKAEGTASKNGEAGGNAVKFTLRGDQDWQDTGVTLKKGDTVRIVATGKWTTMNVAPKADGSSRQVSKKNLTMKERRMRRTKAAQGNLKTADELNIQGKVGILLHGNGGSEWSFEAKNEGNLSLRMMGYEVLKDLSTPGGSLSLTITVSN